MHVPLLEMDPEVILFSIIFINITIVYIRVRFEYLKSNFSKKLRDF